MTGPPGSGPRGRTLADDASGASRPIASRPEGGPGSVSLVFAWELHERLLWFSNLRWLAVVGLAAVSLLGPAVGLDATRPSLMVVAAAEEMMRFLSIVDELQQTLGPPQDIQLYNLQHADAAEIVNGLIKPPQEPGLGIEAKSELFADIQRNLGID